jgi:hypothetical protein
MRKAMIAVMTAVVTLLILALSMNVASATTTIGTVKIVVNGTTYAPIPVTTVTQTATKTVTATSTPTVTVTQPAVTVTSTATVTAPPVTVTADPVTVTSTVTPTAPAVIPYATDATYVTDNAPLHGAVGLLQRISDDTPTHHYDVLLPGQATSVSYFQHTEGVWIMPDPGYRGIIYWGGAGRTEHMLGIDGTAFVPLAEVGPEFNIRFGGLPTP